MTRSPWMVAVKIDNEIQIHAPAAVGDYDTLCGIDSNDPAIGHRGTVPLPAGAKIGCASCLLIFLAARRLRKSDFSKKSKREVIA